MAVKLTEVPAQIEVEDALIVTDGVTDELVIVTWLLVAVAVEAHAAFDVRITLIISPLVKVEEVKVFELVPAFTPFTCH